MVQSINKKDYGLLMIATAVHAIILFCLSCYSKAITVYYDELLLYDAAKSISTGNPITVHGVLVGFKNCLYPILIQPAFFWKDTLKRELAIMIINSIVISFSMVVAFAICKELRVPRRYCWIVAIIIGVWPENSYAMTFMSESAYFPFFLLAILFIIRLFKRGSIVSSAFAGFFSFLVCFCKEVGFCIPVAVVVSELIFGVIDVVKNNNKWKIIKKKAVLIATYGGSFFIMYYINKIVFRNDAARVLYQGIVSKALLILGDPYRILYMVYLTFYYFLTVTVAFLVIPVFVPFVLYKKMNDDNKKTAIFSICLLVIYILVIVVDNGVRENLGGFVPRVHLRYLFPMVGLFFPLTFSYYSFDCEDEYKFSGGLVKSIGYVSMFFLIVGIIFKGVSLQSFVDSISISYISAARKVFSDLRLEDVSKQVYYPGVMLAVVFLFCLFVFGMIIAERRCIRYMLYYFSGIAIVLSIINFGLSYRSLRKSYSADLNAVKEMVRINDYLLGFEKSFNVMYIGDEYYVTTTRIFDQYLDTPGEEYTLDYGKSMDLLQNEDYNPQLSYNVFEDTIKSDKYYVENIDYFITPEPDYLEQNMSGIEKVEGFSNGEYTLFRNIDPLTVEQKENRNKSHQIIFTSAGNNVSEFVRGGISECEGDFTWTEGDKLLIDLERFAIEDTDSLNVKIEVHDTFNGEQSYIVFQNNEYITNGSISGSGEIVFSIPYGVNQHSFSVYLPDATSPQSVGDSLDERNLSLAIKKIIIEAS